MADSYVGGGIGRRMSRGEKFGDQGKEPSKPPMKEPEGHGHSAHATIHKHGPGHFTVEHEHGQSGPHHSFHEAAQHAGHAMGEEMTSEPESQDDAPIENALGMMGGEEHE